ncbi:MAG: tRNA epoxyqueuosine(34) reductase QueG [Planctomycetes bacterium]|nr:tRNA epoxyqueuosine(34) reductase QueG [Planctomycetota bacterium]
MREAIIAKARELGFDHAGLARVQTLPRGAFLREWLRRGYHGEMVYLERAPEVRMDPSRLLPGARTVIVVAKNYATSVRRTADPRCGTVSRYAWGRDYHEVLRGKLSDLADFIARSGAHAKACVDTSPILEKLWAQQTGIGWQGKHSNVLSKAFSGWIFLGEVLTDAELEPDRPAANHCGRCARCIDACPTRAIVAPYVVDARRCIAYLTIEHRGSIPMDLRPLLGSLIFGCDICLEACPWNKFAKVAPEAAFLPRDGLEAPRLSQFLGMTREAFNRRFVGSPIRRAKRAGFLRNVCVALGNSGDSSAIPALEGALGDEEPLVRAHAAWALGNLGILLREAYGGLERRLAVESNEEVRREITAAIRAYRTNESTGS